MVQQQTAYELETGDLKLPATGRPVVYSTHGVISSGHYLTSMAGMRMLLSGGNAFDAAVAAVLPPRWWSLSPPIPWRRRACSCYITPPAETSSL